MTNCKQSTRLGRDCRMETLDQAICVGGTNDLTIADTMMVVWKGRLPESETGQLSARRPTNETPDGLWKGR
ncbi:hypothetical protein BaRGS_00038186, partial [Batillaria attramentaria]